MIRLALNGATGRMGQRVCVQTQAADDINLVVQNSRGHTSVNTVSDVDLIIDFSTNEGVLNAVDLCDKYRAALLVCTTGLSAQSTTAIRTCAQHSPVMIAPNTSRGVAVMTHVLTAVATLLGDRYDVNISEAHHSGKRDCPSGTALRLADAVRVGGTDISPSQIHSIRAGEIIGKHCVQFADHGEILEFSHSAISRDLFATGALEAGRWLVQQPPGTYDIAQAWGLPARNDSQ